MEGSLIIDQDGITGGDSSTAILMASVISPLRVFRPLTVFVLRSVAGLPLGGSSSLGAPLLDQLRRMTYSGGGASSLTASARPQHGGSPVEQVLKNVEWPEKFPFKEEDFSRFDGSLDSLFYSEPRFVTHIDDPAISALTKYYSKVFPPSNTPGVCLLDMCSSWVLTEYIVQDLNVNPKLPFEDSSFDVITNVVSVDYLTKPIAVFKEMQRILKPEGLAIISFSNRCFWTKAISIWTSTGDSDHAWIVGSYFHYAGGFEPPLAVDISPNPGRSYPIKAKRRRETKEEDVYGQMRTGERSGGTGSEEEAITASSSSGDGGGSSRKGGWGWVGKFHRDLLAGALMGGMVHTVVAPIERAKLLLQTQEGNAAILGFAGRPRKDRFRGMFDCIFRTVRDEGSPISLARKWNRCSPLLSFRGPQFFLKGSVIEGHGSWNALLYARDGLGLVSPAGRNGRLVCVWYLVKELLYNEAAATILRGPLLHYALPLYTTLRFWQRLNNPTKDAYVDSGKEFGQPILEAS
ncbi:hypothetical protein HPP92_009131 [Vanilla planifolia]|uniref:Methyltransferase type 11 domain-containing protein n=1 Tax=Vanilla planifolia TaxID=51239 RepID=A0A835RFM0_VANPL|nr:hypothetical protein HPP92_009131 [Vanilla planifolia]